MSEGQGPAAGRSVVAGSERAVPPGASDAGAVDPTARTSVTIVLRPREPFPAHVGHGTQPTLSREEFAARYGATPEDARVVERFALDAGLLVVEASLARRSVIVEGALGDIAAAFEAELRLFDSPAGRFRGRTGTLTVPADIGPIVVGVFGIDERPQARAQIRSAAKKAVSYSPPEVAAAYGFPSGVTGAGQTIALIELGGGFVQADLDTFFAGLGIASPTVTSVGVDGAANAPAGDPNSADGEVMLDIEVAGSIAPGAAIVCYFAPNTDQGFLDAITTAVHDTTNKPGIISISWGGPESTWTAQALSNFDAAFAAAGMLGITVTVAAGDSGSSDGLTDGLAHVDFPASSPNVLACGGTHLTVKDAAISAETVWNDGSSGGATGGGISDVFPLPAWQQAANVPPSANPGASAGRGVPDVSGDAAPDTGYAIVVDGSDIVVGGTSAVAPLWAALVALLNETATTTLGFINAQLYADPAVLRDITSGNNGAYEAGVGWDACTGLGSPNGVALASLLGTPPPATTPPPMTTTPPTTTPPTTTAPG
jgi:kumamolisin